MLKRILVLLGETASSLSARHYAFQLARRMDAELAGLAGVDLAYIEAPMMGRVGADAWKIRLETRLREQAKASRRRLHEAYANECSEHGIRFEWMSFEGDPDDALRLATESCDLVVTGHDTAFRGQIRERLAEVLGELLLTTPRPVVVCGDEPGAEGDILIAYDGSVPSMRAVQMFALLGEGEGRRACVTSIDASEETAARRTVAAAAYLRMHGYEVEQAPIASGARAADALRIEVADRKIGTLVMGAYGHRGFREALFGSTTTSLAESPPCALFLYH
jgi:nucleotide-binding universal stress UspA family protein